MITFVIVVSQARILRRTTKRVWKYAHFSNNKVNVSEHRLECRLEHSFLFCGKHPTLGRAPGERLSFLVAIQHL